MAEVDLVDGGVSAPFGVVDSCHEMAEHRGDFLGVVFEAEVGKVDSVNGAVVFNSVEVFAVDVVEIFGIFGFQTFVVAAEGFVLSFEIIM